MRLLSSNGSKAERFYRALRIGKMREAEVAVAIAEYALSLPDGVRLSVYSPDIDVDAIDAVLRVETGRNVEYMEIQVTSTRNASINIGRLLATMEKYESIGA